mgnify:CR=1 FL=1
MNSKELEFYFDYLSPYAYFGWINLAQQKYAGGHSFRPFLDNDEKHRDLIIDLEQVDKHFTNRMLLAGARATASLHRSLTTAEAAEQAVDGGGPQPGVERQSLRPVRTQPPRRPWPLPPRRGGEPAVERNVGAARVDPLAGAAHAGARRGPCGRATTWPCPTTATSVWCSPWA